MLLKLNIVFFIFAIFCVLGIMSSPSHGNLCKSHGSPCDSDAECCNNAKCHRFAKQCQIPIDAESLQAQRNRLRHVDNKYSH